MQDLAVFHCFRGISHSSMKHRVQVTPPDTSGAVGERDKFFQLPSSGSDVEDEADFQDVDPTFTDNFVRGLGVLCPVVDMTINDDWRPAKGWRNSRVCNGFSARHEFISMATVVLANPGTGHSGRFAVWAQEGSEDGG